MYKIVLNTRNCKIYNWHVNKGWLMVDQRPMLIHACNLVNKGSQNRKKIKIIIMCKIKLLTGQ